MVNYIEYGLNIDPDKKQVVLRKISDIVNEPEKDIKRIINEYTNNNNCRYSPHLHKKLSEMKNALEGKIMKLSDYCDIYTNVLNRSSYFAMDDRIACYLIKITSVQEMEKLTGIYMKYNINDKKTSELKNMIARLTEIKHKTLKYLEDAGFPTKMQKEEHNLWKHVWDKELERRNLVKKQSQSLNNDEIKKISARIKEIEEDMKNTHKSAQILCKSELYMQEIEIIMFYMGINNLTAKTALTDAENLYRDINENLEIQDEIFQSIIGCEDTVVKKIINEDINELINAKKDNICTELSRSDTKMKGLNTRLGLLGKKTNLSGSELEMIYSLCRNFNGNVDIETLKQIRDGKISISGKIKKSARTKESHILEKAGLKELEHLYAWINIKKDLEKKEKCIRNSIELINNEDLSGTPANICACVKPFVEQLLEVKRVFDRYNSGSYYITKYITDSETVIPEGKNRKNRTNEDPEDMAKILTAISDISKELVLES